MKKNSLNLPNILSLLRVAMVPAFMATLLFMQEVAIWGRIVPMLIFCLAAFTDFLDGYIARKRKLVTDFGKLIDPLADKFMVFGALVSLLVTDVKIAPVLVWVAALIMFRELGVTSLRLVVAGKSGKVVAASLLGKLKTVSQMVGFILIFIDPILGELFPFLQNRLVSYIALGVMSVTTVFSGIDYAVALFPLIDTNE